MQVDENMLAVNHLRPYSSWKEFFPTIKKAFEAYLNVANPKGIQRIGLRYINEINIPEVSLELEDYFNFRPFIHDDLPQKLSSFTLGATFIFDEGRNLAKVQLLTSKQNDDKSIFILDIDYFLAKSDISLNEPKKNALKSVYEWIDSAHSDLENVFEGALTDKTKKLFDKGKI
mgnify:CR=1 FL=1